MAAHILIIEDDPVLSYVLSRIVESVGYSADGASSGLDALEKLKLQQFDLLILDMYMPELSGWEFLEVYKQHPVPLAPVVIVTTGPVEEGEFPDTLVITKPFKSNQILEAISQVLSS
jgi:CheY-like chemotaxis protein